MDLRILSMDPGTANFAVSVLHVRYDKDGFRFKVIGTAMLDPKKLLKDIKIAHDQLGVFVEYVRPLFKLRLDAFIAERFQSRGGKGPTIESVNMMLGAMDCLARDAEIESVSYCTAGVWKNEFNRNGDLKEMYLDLAEARKDKYRPHVKIHQLDSELLGLYKACQLCDLKPFSFIKSRKHESRLLGKLDSAPELRW